MAQEMATKLVLPTEATGADRSWINQRFIIIGQPGVGKSTLWSNDPNALFIDTEGTIGHLNVKRLACRTMDDARAIYGALTAARAAGNFPYTTLVFDTIDKLVDAAEQEVIAWGKAKFKRVDVESIGDIPEGGGYSKLSKAVMSLLDSFDSLPAALAIVSHPKQTKIKDPAGLDFDKETITLFPSIANRLLGWSTNNLHVQSRWVGNELQRIVRTQPERGIEAKSHGGIVPDRWQWQTRDLADEFAKLRSLFV